MTQKSGLYYPNIVARIYLDSVQEIVGKSSLNAILNLAKLSHFIDNFPPNNFDLAFDFADFASLNKNIQQMYGPRRGRGLILRASRIAFTKGQAEFENKAEIGHLALKPIALQTKLKIGLEAISEVFNQFSDQKTTIEEHKDYFVYTLHQCAMCYQREDQQSICYPTLGFLQEALRWVSSGSDFRIEIVGCKAKGDKAGCLHIYKEPYQK